MAEVDDPQEAQTDAAIAVASLVIADVILSQPEPEDDVDFWVPLFIPTLKVVLISRLLGLTGPMFPQASPVVTRRAVERASTDSTYRAAEIVAQNVPEMREAEPAVRRAEAVVTSGRASRAAIVGGRESARFEVAEGLGAVYKVWRTRRDARVRATHGGLEGNKIPLGNEFITFEGHHLRFPRDPKAPLSETAECRCRLSYIL